jgi:hypothetical protein
MTTSTLRRLCLLVAAITLEGCASSAFRPTEVNPSGTPYEGLNENSYGARSAMQFRYCDPDDDVANNPNMAPEGRSKTADLAHELAAGVTSVVGAPLQGLTKVDAGIVELGLAGYFKVPSDSDHPTVAVLSRADDSIVFWHSAKLARLSEVTAAAQAYCSKRQKTLLYRGSATRCPRVERGLSGMPVINTYAISAFACIGR